MRTRLSLVIAIAVLATAGPASAADPRPREILDRALDANPWGQGGAEVVTRAIITDAKGKGAKTRELKLTGRARRYAPTLTKSLVRFSAPADMNGVSFLQIQQKGDDDERHLYLPDLKRSRRVGGDMRSGAFMGTDFSYADLDQRDLRRAAVKGLGSETVAKHDCWKLEAVPSAKGATYARVEVWVRKDNFVALKSLMYNKAGVLLKTMTVSEVRRVSGRWYITKATMVSHEQHRQTDLIMDKIDVQATISDDQFTVRNLEKI